MDYNQTLLFNLIRNGIITIGDQLRVTGTNYFAIVAENATLLINGEINNPVDNLTDFIASLGLNAKNILEIIECKGKKLSYYKKLLEHNYMIEPNNNSNQFNNETNLMDPNYRMLLYDPNDIQVPYWLTNRYPLYNNMNHELFVKRYLEMDIQSSKEEFPDINFHNYYEKPNWTIF